MRILLLNSNISSLYNLLIFINFYYSLLEDKTQKALFKTVLY